jgi:hypothetical protein
MQLCTLWRRIGLFNGNQYLWKLIARRSLETQRRPAGLYRSGRPFTSWAHRRHHNPLPSTLISDAPDAHLPPPTSASSAGHPQPPFLALSALGVGALLSAEANARGTYPNTQIGELNLLLTEKELITPPRKTKNPILSGVFGGPLSAANLAVLAATGSPAYDRWVGARVWTRRNVHPWFARVVWCIGVSRLIVVRARAGAC